MGRASGLLTQELNRANEIIYFDVLNHSRRRAFDFNSDAVLSGIDDFSGNTAAVRLHPASARVPENGITGLETTTIFFSAKAENAAHM